MNSREERLRAEMSPDTNMFIPGGQAADEAIRQLKTEDTAHAGVLRREMANNPLIPGSPYGYSEAELSRLFHTDRKKFWEIWNERLD